MAFKMIRGNLRSLLVKQTQLGINKRSFATSSPSYVQSPKPSSSAFDARSHKSSPSASDAQCHKSSPPASNTQSHKSSSLDAKSQKSFWSNPDIAPIYVLVGLIGVVICIGFHTAKQQLVHAPSVTFSKTKREMMQEVDDAPATMNSSSKFLSKSFLRKVGSIQDETKEVLPNPNYAKAKVAIAESRKST